MATAGSISKRDSALLLSSSGHFSADSHEGSLQASDRQEEVVTLANLSPARKKLLFACLAANNVFVCMCLSIMAPIFPLEVRKMYPTRVHGSGMIIGLIFSSATLTEFFFSPIVAREVPKIGPKRTLVLGALVVAGVACLFSFVSQMYDWPTFLGFCFTLRLTQGFGTAMVFTSSFTLLAGIYPEKVAMMTGLLEMFNGLGFLIGPALGGVLYQFGGFMVPFMTNGCVLLLGALSILVILPNTSLPEEEGGGNGGAPVTMWTVLGVLRNVLLLVTITISIGTFTFMDPTMGPYLRWVWHLRPAAIGATFLLFSGSYSILGPITGFLSDKYHTIGRKLFIPLGLLVSSIGCQLIGPETVFGMHPSLASVLCGATMIGLGAGFSVVPVSADVLSTTKDLGFGDSMELHSAVGGVTGSAVSLGVFVGPLFGGLLTDHFNFNDGLASIGAVHFTLAVAIAVQTVFELRKKRRQGGSPLDVSERTPLVEGSSSF